MRGLYKFYIYNKLDIVRVTRGRGVNAHARGGRKRQNATINKHTVTAKHPALANKCVV